MYLSSDSLGIVPETMGESPPTTMDPRAFSAAVARIISVYEDRESGNGSLTSELIFKKMSRSEASSDVALYIATGDSTFYSESSEKSYTTLVAFDRVEDSVDEAGGYPRHRSTRATVLPSRKRIFGFVDPNDSDCYIFPAFADDAAPSNEIERYLISCAVIADLFDRKLSGRRGQRRHSGITASFVPYGTGGVDGAMLTFSFNRYRNVESVAARFVRGRSDVIVCGGETAPGLDSVRMYDSERSTHKRAHWRCASYGWYSEDFAPSTIERAIDTILVEEALHPKTPEFGFYKQDDGTLVGEDVLYRRSLDGADYVHEVTWRGRNYHVHEVGARPIVQDALGVALAAAPLICPRHTSTDDRLCPDCGWQILRRRSDFPRPGAATAAFTLGPCASNATLSDAPLEAVIAGAQWKTDLWSSALRRFDDAGDSSLLGENALEILMSADRWSERVCLSSTILFDYSSERDSATRSVYATVGIDEIGIDEYQRLVTERRFEAALGRDNVKNFFHRGKKSCVAAVYTKTDPATLFSDPRISSVDFRPLPSLDSGDVYVDGRRYRTNEAPRTLFFVVDDSIARVTVPGSSLVWIGERLSKHDENAKVTAENLRMLISQISLMLDSSDICSGSYLVTVSSARHADASNKQFGEYHVTAPSPSIAAHLAMEMFDKKS